MKAKLGIAATAIVGMMGLSGVVPTQTVGQTISQVSSQDQAALAEAERLNQQVDQLYQQGKYNEAIPLAEQALAIRKNVLGKNHLDTATSFNNLAFLYNLQGRYAEAEPLYQEALAIHKAQLGDNHPVIATSLDNLAGLYLSQGRYPEAELLYRETLAIRKQQLGDNHPVTAISLNNLAGLYLSQGRYPEAEPLYKEALYQFSKVLQEIRLGEYNPNPLKIE